MSITSSPDKVTQAMALLVEGKDEQYFFEALLKHIDIPPSSVFIRDVGGEIQFRTKLPALLQYPGFRENVKSYGIIRDANKNSTDTFQSVVYLLKSLGQPCPDQANTFSVGLPKVGVYLMPGIASAGMLEDLCMKTVSDNPAVTHVDKFIDSVRDGMAWKELNSNTSPPIFPNNLSKARAKAFLAVNTDDLPNIGIAAKAGVWNFDSDSMKHLKDFLENLKV